MEFSAQFEGLDRLVADVRAIAQDADAELERAVRETTANALRTLAQATPVKTGHARRGWDMRFPAPLVGEVSTNLPLLWFLEWGTGLYSEAEGAKREKYKIAPVRAKALAFQWSKAATLGIATSQHRMGADARGRSLYRTRAGNVGLHNLAADLVIRNYVMHPGIKPVGMVRGNLPLLQRDFEERAQVASDRLVARFTGRL